MRHEEGKDLMRMGMHTVGLFHHSTLFAGKPAKSAGMMLMSEKGSKGSFKLDTLISKTGHYQVPYENLKVTIKWLLKNGYGDSKHWCGSGSREPVLCQNFHPLGGPPEGQPSISSTCFKEFPDVFGEAGIHCPAQQQPAAKAEQRSTSVRGNA